MTTWEKWRQGFFCAWAAPNVRGDRVLGFMAIALAILTVAEMAVVDVLPPRTWASQMMFAGLVLFVAHLAFRLHCMGRMLLMHRDLVEHLLKQADEKNADT